MHKSIHITAIMGISSLLSLTACATSDTTHSAHKSGAVLSQPSASALGTINQTIRQALGGRPVFIAEDSFLKTDHVYIETKDHIAPDGLPIMGRKTRDQGFAPVRFNLIKRGKSCVLVRADTGKKYKLDGVKCTVLNTP